MTWEIVATRHDAHHLIADLKAGDVERTVYLTAGLLAAIGRTGPPLYDGKPGNIGGSMGVHRPSLAEKRPLLTGNNGGAVGVNATALHQKRPVIQHGGRGVHRLAHQVPDLSGDSGAAGRGIHASGFLARSGGLQAYMRALSDRLRRVDVCCGDFERVLGPAVTTCISTTGVFLDPPYPEDGRAICYSHDGDGVWWRAYQWAIDHGEDPKLRIALCGYEHPDAIFRCRIALVWRCRLSEPRLLVEWIYQHPQYGWTILYRIAEIDGERRIESAEPGFDSLFWEDEPSLSGQIEAELRNRLPIGHPDRPTNEPLQQAALFDAESPSLAVGGEG